MATASNFTVGEMSGNGLPRSDRVDEPGPPAQTTLSSSNTPSHTSLSLSSQSRPTATIPPAVPVRSPLRPPPKAFSSSQGSSGTNSRSSRATLETPPLSVIEDCTVIVDSSTDDLPMQQANGLQSIQELLVAVNAISEDQAFFKGNSVRSDSPALASVDSRSRVPRKSESSSSSSSSSVPTQTSGTSQSTMTKRQHALHELLSSERAYASDLALINEVHFPLAMGHPVLLPNLRTSPPNSSASSSRTLSTASDSSTNSLGSPMTQEDARIIFNNIPELAGFSDRFCDLLEAALGSVVEGGTGEDRVGDLFIQIIPELERPYQQYITRHPTALQHLQSLPQTPALQAYLSETQKYAASHSHAWDLASLLIKPVQRLLKYPLLLSAIIDETPDTHPDKANLKMARAQMEEVARNVNETRRRAEVVKDVLSSKKKSVNVTVAATVNLSKMRNLRTGSIKGQSTEENGEAAQVERMSQELKRIELFAQQFAKNVVEWSRSMSKVVTALRAWALRFGRVVGLITDLPSEEGEAEMKSEAFDAFLAVIGERLMPLCVDLEAIISERLLKEIAHLLKTMNQPYKLITSMQEQEPFHWHLLNMTVSSKNRPPPALLAASTNYLALRAQLAAELPTYLALLHRGMAISIRRLADIQTRFWKDVMDRWADLWEMLRVEEELNVGHEETVAVWHSRWMEVDQYLTTLSINQMKKIYQEPERARPSANNLQAMLSSLEPGHAQRRPSNVANKLSALEPSNSSSYASSYVSHPYPLAPSTRRGRPQTDDYSSRQTLSRRSSNESLFTTSRKTKGKSPGRKSGEEHARGQDIYYPSPHPYSYNHSGANSPSYSAIPRRKSMPLPSDILAHSAPIRRNTSPPPRVIGVYEDGDGPQIYHPYSAPIDVADSHRDRRDSDERPSRLLRTNSSKKKSDGGKIKATQNRQRSSSVTSFFKSGPDKHHRDSPPVPALQPDMFLGYRDNWVSKPAKYHVVVIHPCRPPPEVTYFSFPFFTLSLNELYEVLQETGHPSLHDKLPLYVDDGEDCLLLVRDRNGTVGWALASFFEPINLPR